jgi:alpha-maltose-1-phosphate synthase
MRILTVTHFFEAHGGGIERVAGHLCRQFSALGHRPAWAASAEDAPPDAATAEAVPLRCINPVERLTGLPMPVPGPAAARRLWRAVADSDAVVVHDALYLTSVVAVTAAHRLGKPAVLVQHIAGIPFPSPVLRSAADLGNRLVGRPMLQSADQVVFISETTRHAFRAVPTRRPPLVLFNGVDSATFRPGARGDEGLATRAALGVSPGERLVLFVGRFVQKKGLAAIAALARLRPDLRFVLAGQGPIDPAAWGLANVAVARGRSGGALAALYRAADLLLLPSVGEGYPLVVQEAMASGLPVVCGEESTRADPGARRWLTGVEVDPARPEETARRAARAIDAHGMDEAERAAMAEYARRAYDWRLMASRLVDSIAASPRGAEEAR